MLVCSLRVLFGAARVLLALGVIALAVMFRGGTMCLGSVFVVFIIVLVGNSIGFGNRFLSALMSAILFALVFGVLVYFGYGSVSMSVTMTPSANAPAQAQK